MRILMISPQFRPIVGGYERAAERLSVALAKRGHVVTVGAERRDPAWPPIEYNDGVKICRWWCFYVSGWHQLTSLLGLAVYLLRHGRAFDVWHVHQYGVHAALAAFAAQVLRRKLVLKLTSSQHQGLAESLSRGRFSKVLRFLHRKIDAVVALSRETAQEAVAFGIPAARVEVIGNGVEVSTFLRLGADARMALRKSLGLSEGLVVLFVGRLAVEKNPDGLLRAWRIARPRLPGSSHLVLVGDGPMAGALRSFAETEGLGDSVSFVGQQANVPLWLYASDMYVLPSHNEGFSNAMLEAMAASLPIVATRVSSATEVLEETGAGVVVDIGDMDQFADKLVRLALDEPLRERMGALGRRVVQERYAIESVAMRHERLYAKLVGTQAGCGDWA